MGLRAIVLALALGGAAALSFEVSAADSAPRCFREQLPRDAVLSGAFQILNPSDDRAVAVQVLGPDDVVLHEDRVDGDRGRFAPTALSEGWHQVCFHVSHEAAGTEPARMQVQLIEGEAASYGELATLVNVNSLQQSVRKLRARMDFIQKQQDTQKARELEFRMVVDEANSGAAWYSVAQILVLVLSALWQVKHLQSFFHQKKLV